MKITFKLNENDFLVYQLYANSKSDISVNRRKHNKYIYSFFFIFAGVINLYLKSTVIGAGAIIYGVIRFLYYQKYSKYYLEKYLKSYIKENYLTRVDKESTLEFKDEGIFTKDYTSTSLINRSELENLIELKDYFFLKIKTNQMFIIPKDTISNNFEFINCIEKYNIPLINELKWRWK